MLADLLETVASHLQPSLRIMEVEGDAIFAFAPAAAIEASMLLDVVEQTYFAFRSRLRDVTQATTCTCDACRLIPSLDLKFVVHNGRFMRKEVAGAERLTGTDVVLLHRLLKNTVTDGQGMRAYALVTEACVDALGVDPAALGMVEHRERYEDVGEVVGYLSDLAARWRYEEARRRVFVLPAEAQFEATWELPVPVAVAWEYQTSPQKRLRWQTDISRIDEDVSGGRRGEGTETHCVHGRGAIVERMLDWRPFRYFTRQITLPGIGPWTFTSEFAETERGETEMRMRAERLSGRRRLVWAMVRRPVMSKMRGDMERLEELLRAEAAAASG